MYYLYDLEVLAIDTEQNKTRLRIVGPLPAPYIGPAVATETLLRSEIIRTSFDVDFLDLSDREGVEGIGRFDLHNIHVALAHACTGIAMLFRRRPDVLYIPIDRGFWGFIRDIALMLPARLVGVRVVAHLRAGRFDLVHDYGFMGRMVARLGLACVSRVLVLGDSLRGIFGDYVPQQKIRVAPNGIDLSRWRFDPITRISHTDEFTVAYIGNLFHDKGAHVLLQALPHIVKQVPSLRVEFAGDWIDDDYRTECEGIVEQNALENHVTFLGRVDDERKRLLLARADILAFVPVKPEGSPWVVLEGMASSLPVVGTPQGTMKEVIVDGETGYLVTPGDTVELAERIIELALDTNLRRRLGKAGRRRIEEVYCERVTLRRLADLIEETAHPVRKSHSQNVMHARLSQPVSYKP